MYCINREFTNTYFPFLYRSICKYITHSSTIFSFIDKKFSLLFIKLYILNIKV